MSSLIERTATAFRGAGKQGAPGASTGKAPDVQAKLSEALAALAKLEEQHGNIALDDLLGIEGATARLSKLMAQMATARDTIATLRAAHATALERDAEAERAQRASLHKTQLAAVKANLEKRDAAAEAFAIAAAEAIRQFRIVVEKSAKAHAANPIGGNWPDGGVREFGDIRRRVAQELYRLDARDFAIGDEQHFPGAAVHDFNKIGQPAAIVPLADELKANSAYIITTLTGRPVS